ncbi:MULTISPECIES: UDP-glucose dehydrogenase family protein [Gordonia]|uniref:UDP-glucose dehydrogenase family protein n=1 Tax=Gordonia TaxID=2053 RepID=UPI00244AC84A|nr:MULTISPECIES: UDP-glucose/GDP-mannose dehydrogenase family protein [Gordonia]MDH3021143.1 UDP-glucose/GDP-mannose dehydrogenase family protein [Gordonia alkanivorans]MDH3026702.1 UDP-glucose/GDP-mannose dehydrogenase family protein [Gordonia alkanivorans]MDH3043452.1 UDP-glucose/GDP-mannose dehydrogenase family protein [Gordonia alkanivorans]MDJ0010235.1 UDP-glucose/GDP-mannose dehydrogenase family protein [Gordonia alkanivorans]MDJ0028138.1 UDP-glucose/GDP-mannose dehydrogenase family prot
MKLTVIGCGYLGATHAACMAELGHDVVGIDIDPQKVERLQAGDVPFFEPGLSDILRRNLDAGRLRFTTDHSVAAEHASVHFIGVGTPQEVRGHRADLSHVHAAVDALVPTLRGIHVLIGKSTVPVGTCGELSQRISHLSAPGADVELAWSPEFLREGFAVEDTLAPDRMVVGVGRLVDDPRVPQVESLAGEVIRDIYREVLETGIPFIETDWATAELVKVSANAFLATKISFINAMSELCEIAGADVGTLADAMGHDARIGRRFLNAGLGFGGGCLPKDIRALTARADEMGAPRAVGFLREVDAINMRRRGAAAELVAEALGGEVLGRNVAVLGTAFKPESDDVRDSPALAVAGRLALDGASVTVFDPQAMDNSRRVQPMLSYASSARAACDRADVVVVATEWAEFVHMSPDELAPVVRHKRIVDARRCLDSQAWRSAGWDYRALGGPVPARKTETTTSFTQVNGLPSKAIPRVDVLG